MRSRAGSRKARGATKAKMTSGALLAALPPETALTHALLSRPAACPGIPVISIPHLDWFLERDAVRRALPFHPRGSLAMRFAEATASPTLFRWTGTLLVAARVSSTPRSLTWTATWAPKASAT